MSYFQMFIQLYVQNIIFEVQSGAAWHQFNRRSIILILTLNNYYHFYTNPRILLEDVAAIDAPLWQVLSVIPIFSQVLFVLLSPHSNS